MKLAFRLLILGAGTLLTVLGACVDSRAEDAEALPSPTPVLPQPPPYILPPPPPPYVWNTPELNEPSPLLDRPTAAQPGWFTNVETSVVWIHLRNELMGGQAVHGNIGQTIPGGLAGGLPITGDVIKFPGNKFDPTVTPRFEVGYRFPDSWGDIHLSYRFLDSQGSDQTDVALYNLGPASQTGRLDVQFVDLDYGTRQFSLGPDWQLRTSVGLRYSSVYFDSTVNFLNPTPITATGFGTAPFTRLSQTEVVSNWYLGAHGVVEVARTVCWPELFVFGRVEGAGVWGRVHQKFKETFVEAPGYTEQQNSNGVGCPMINAQVGLSYEVPNWNHSRVMVGYQYEMWWQFGRGDNDLSYGTLYDQGLFLRAELNF